MKNLIRLTSLLLLFLSQSCITIPKIQQGGFVEKISNTNVQFKDGQNFKIAKNKNVEQTTIILVRHAEKMKDSKDPLLTKEGMNRAENLKEILSSTAIDHIFSTDYKRTQATAAPTAASKNLEVISYNPKKMNAFGKMLLDNYQGKTILVAGHSNTTPKLLNFLMNETVVKSIDESDYENLFIITVSKDDERKAVLLKFDN